MANLIALLEALGSEGLALVEYLVAHKDQIQIILELIDLMLPLLHVTPSKQAVSDEQFIEACKQAGASTGDAQELLAAMPG